MEVREWISTDETAKTFFSRIAIERPPLHRLPLRPGNVVEIAGPSPSAKTHILLQVAVNCILPNEWKGVFYGGLEQSLMFIDLDCRLDVLRLVQLLKHRILVANRSNVDVNCSLQDAIDQGRDEELITKCLERFVYVRCYDSLEFIATLKSLSYQLQDKRDLYRQARVMMIDSIGAYYWVDRASTSLPLGSNIRKALSLQSMTEAIVREIQNFLLVKPMLVLATKATIFGDKSRTSVNQSRAFRKWSSEDAFGERTLERDTENILHREYMPSTWQSFVTHRISIQPSNSGLSPGNYDSTHEQVYMARWLLPSLGFRDKFVVRDAVNNNSESTRVAYSWFLDTDAKLAYAIGALKSVEWFLVPNSSKGASAVIANVMFLEFSTRSRQIDEVNQKR